MKQQYQQEGFSQVQVTLNINRLKKNQAIEQIDRLLELKEDIPTAHKENNTGKQSSDIPH